MANTKQESSVMLRTLALCAASALLVSGCADSVSPSARNVSIPAPKLAEERSKGVNENGDAVIYLPLGKDVLVPQSEEGDPLPSTIVGPFELRGETLAGALQLILDGTNIPIAFESEEGLTKTVTVTNLRGPLDSVVHEICSLGDMYCSFQNGMLVVKDTQVFTVSIPPIVESENVSALLTNISGAVGDITGAAPITDASTRTIVYRASQRTAELARRYFQRLRSSTALVIFETYVWEVSLDSGNTTGIKWTGIEKIGKYKFGVNISGGTDLEVGAPISIGLPTTGTIDFDVNDVFEFVSSYGAVKTVSQPQITVLSGSTAKLRVADKQNYVASLSRSTTDGGTTTVSTTTDSVDSGFTLNIGSNWDNSTVYGNIDILLQEVRGIDTFDDNPDAIVQLPQTTERELQTQVRIRPGDLLLIAGLVRESDSLDKEGLGSNEPVLPFSRAAKVENTELVFLLRPRVVVFTPEGETSPRKSPQIANVAASSTPALVEPETYVAKEPVPLPDNPVSMPEPEANPDSSFQQVLSEAAPAEESMPVSKAASPEPLPVQEVAPVVEVKTETTIADAAPSVEINMPEETAVSSKAAADTGPSVIVNYDALGR